MAVAAMTADPTDNKKLIKAIVLKSPSQVSASTAPIMDEKYRISSLA